MQGNGNRTSRAQVVVLVAVVAGLALAVAVAFWSSRSRVASVCVQPVPPTVVRAPVPAASVPGLSAKDLAARIAWLEQSQKDLDGKRRELFEKMVAARGKAAAAGDSELTAEMRKTQAELDAAIDAHPSVVARKNQMQRLLDESHVADTNSAAVLTALHAKQNENVAAFKKAQADLAKESMEDRKKLLREIGKTDLRKLTPEEAEKLTQLDAKHIQEYQAFFAEFENKRKNPDESEKKLKSEFDALREDIARKNTRYGELYTDLPAFRSRLRAEDPAIAALDRKLMDLQARRQARQNADPDAATLGAQIQDVERQQNETANQLRLLRIQYAAAISKDAPKADGKNG
jgi:chromosome segregation ATPase